MKENTENQADTYANQSKSPDIRVLSEILSRQSRRYNRIFREEPEVKHK